MKIDESLIEEKALAGNNNDIPVIYIKSYGGLHAFFTKSDGGIKMIGAAPHKAIAKYFAEKEMPNIKWNDDFQKNEDPMDSNFNKYRDIIFSDIKGDIEFDSLLRKYYFVYDINKAEISIACKDDINKAIVDKEIDTDCIIRDADLSRPYSIIAEHPDFDMIFKSNLRKEMFFSDPEERVGKEFHGVITPKGQWIKMKPNEIHYGKIHELETGKEYPYHGGKSKFISRNIVRDDIIRESFFNEHLPKGYIAVGVSGRPEIVMHHSIALNPSHPAMKTLRDLVSKHSHTWMGTPYPNLNISITSHDINPNTSESVVGYQIEPEFIDKFIRHGIIKQRNDLNRIGNER